LKKNLIALLIIALLAISLGTYVFMQPRSTPSSQRYSVTFTITPSNLVITNNGTLNLEPFSFTVNTFYQDNSGRHYENGLRKLTGCTNTTLEPNAQVSLLPGSYEYSGFDFLATYIESVSLTYNGTIYNFTDKAAGSTQLYVQFAV
jgi:hypothetical protein